MPILSLHRGMKLLKNVAKKRVSAEKCRIRRERPRRRLHTKR